MQIKLAISGFYVEIIGSGSEGRWEVKVHTLGADRVL
jgi:hypothetical protein